MTMPVRGALCAALIVASGIATPARAEDDAQRKAAQDLADSAYDLMQKGRFEAAAELFDKADRVVHSPVFVLFRAEALEKLGRLVEARRLLQSIADETLAPDAPEAFRSAQAQARERGAALDAKIPTVTIRVRGAPTALALDGEAVPLDALRRPIPLDPGSHSVRAEGDGDSDERRFEAGEGDRLTIALTLAAPEPPDAGVPNWVWPTIAYGVGGAGLIVGTISGIVFLGKLGDLEDRCASDGDGDDRNCPPEAQADGDAVATLGNVSTAGWVIAGVGIAAGTALLFIPIGEQGAVVGGLRLGPTGAAITGSF